MLALALFALAAGGAPAPAAPVAPVASGDGDAACTAKLEDENARARRLQARGKRGEAAHLLEQVKAACFAKLSARRQGWLVSDLALLAHKRGDDDECLALLREAPALEPGSVVARALAFNTGLCGGGCVPAGAQGGPECDSVERGLVRRRAEEGDGSFRSAPCAVGAFAGAVAITPPSGRGSACLALVPATAASAKGTRWRCPRLAVIEKSERGRLKRHELSFPSGAIVDEQACCNLTDLSVKSGPGSTLLRVRGAGRDCVEGASFGDYDEVFRFDGGRVVFDHADDVH